MGVRARVSTCVQPPSPQNNPFLTPVPHMLWATKPKKVGTLCSRQQRGTLAEGIRFLTPHVDIRISHQQHRQRMYLRGVPHEDAPVGLDRHEVGQPTAVQLGGLPAEEKARDIACAGSCLFGEQIGAPGGTYLLMVDLCKRTVPALVRYV